MGKTMNSNNNRKDVIEPHVHDVLLGRGKGTYRHQGNIAYRELIHMYKSEYISCKKNDKRKISERIVRAIRSQDPPGRFIELDSNSGSWTVVANKRAIEKTSQTLRDGHSGDGYNTAPIENSNKNPKDVSHSSYLHNMSEISMLTSSDKPKAFAQVKSVIHPTKQPPIDAKKDNVENNIGESRSSLNFSSYNELILTNLQQDYSKKQKLPVSFNESYQYKDKIAPCNQRSSLLHDEMDTIDSQATMTSNSDYCVDDEVDDEIDDEILMTILDFDDDVSSDINRNSTSRRSSWITSQQPARKKWFSNAAA